MIDWYLFSAGPAPAEDRLVIMEYRYHGVSDYLICRRRGIWYHDYRSTGFLVPQTAELIRWAYVEL